MAKGKYCCFVCPENNWDIKDISDPCPKCGRSFGFPLAQPPTQIGRYRVVAPMGRGFYGAAYSATSGRLNAKSVVKITPVALYTFFGKNFDAESQEHARLAAGSEHVVGIRDVTEEEVEFGNGVKLLCHVADLEHLEGELLQKYIDGTVTANASMVAQIAIDLLRMRQEFAQKLVYHNDLHAENIIVEELPPNMRRYGAIASSIRAKAIDLGSIADDSKTGQQSRVGDLHWIGDHLHALVGRLLAKPDQVEDREYRVALALQSIAQTLVSPPENARVPNVSDLVSQIEGAYMDATQPWRPWTMPLSLKSYGDHYNALTLSSWSVPSLLVDPDGSWMQEVSKAGPQIIIGMRGCGKTMLLRALDFHARAVPQSKGETVARITARIAKDGYVGLFVPAQRLLDVKEQSLKTTEQRIAALAVYFALQAVRSLIHLADLDPKSIALNAHRILEESALDFLKGTDSFGGASSLADLEHRFERLAVAASRNDAVVEIASAPAQVFTRLAEALRRCSTLWTHSQVFFLLDDVSTRYLAVDKIEQMFSILLFSNPICAFKFTSEWQTIELGLRSPGRVNPIRIDRDVSVFDLGSVVHATIKRRGKDLGKNFVERILEQRAAYFPGHPAKHKPSHILGDVSLEGIAHDISGSVETSNTRKKVYRGITCLANVCVGDIGDVIKIYEEILKAWDGKKLPIPDEIQSQCFQDISSLRLYDLNRRRVNLMKTAKAFAEAAYELLLLSKREIAAKKESRLRQYSSVYVRVGETSKDQGAGRMTQVEQVDVLRDLIDAGVFVFSGGNPRTKTKDSNPIHQFKLTYRKIYGLANFIGLADRDRFELSGADLETWLSKVDVAKQTLLRNQKGAIEDEDTDSDNGYGRVDATDSNNDERDSSYAASANTTVTHQSEMSLDIDPSVGTVPAQEPLGVSLAIRVSPMAAIDLRRRNYDVVLTAYGFEERCLASNAELSDLIRPQRIIAVTYPNSGHADAIRGIWVNAGRVPEEILYAECVYGVPDLPRDTLIDVTGMAKPAIFHAVRQQIGKYGRATICHGAALAYYPLKSDLEALFEAESGRNRLETLARLSEVLKGEQGPYEPKRLLAGEGDVLRRRVLLGYVSPKHERIFELLQMREYDGVELVCRTGDDARSRVTQLAGEVLVKNYENAELVTIDSNDLEALARHADSTYRTLYGTAGAAFEVALTGSKLQAVAVAIIGARRRISQAWYVSPKAFDEKRFSQGAGKVSFYDIEVE